MKFLVVFIHLFTYSLSFKPAYKTRLSMKSNLVSTSKFNDNYILKTEDDKEKEKKKVVVEKSTWDEFQDILWNKDSDDSKDSKDSKEPKKKKGPPIYEPGPYPIKALAATAYLVPIADSFDLGKYMFEAYPDVLEAYNFLFGGLSSVYNSVPFLPFALFFLMSYVCRAPTFSVEVRFHFAQAFILSIIQFVPSLLFGLLEKGGVPGLGVAYNTVFLWVMSSCFIMQWILLNPFSSSKNPFLLNVVGFAMRYMNYTPDLAPKR